MKTHSETAGKRPTRLCEATRQFAADSLHHRYGLDTRKTPAVTLDSTENWEFLTPLERYDAAIKKIAKEAPVRVCEGERISGAATLGLAIDHRVPATYQGQLLFSSISHLTVNFETVLRHGTDHIRETVETSLKTHRGSEKEAFLKSCIHCLDSLELWHGRYLAYLKDRPDFAANYQNLKRVPKSGARTFYEAVQSLWFIFAFLRLCGNWPGIGRIDQLLGPYLENDLRKGTITVEEAREILAHFFIKGCEWICGGNYGSGDAQHYQNILLAGVDENGIDVTNTVTYLVLDILEELGISDFPTSVRLNAKTEDKLLRRVAEVLRFGGGILAVYNEDLVIEALTEDGYSLAEARKFANDGCWEVQIPGKTYFIYAPFDSLQILQQSTLNGYEKTNSFENFEALYSAYISDLQTGVNRIFERVKQKFYPEPTDGTWCWKPEIPCTVVSLFEQGCIEKGLSYLEGGPIYNIFSPHIGGFADTVNSLFAIQNLVYKEKRMSLSEFEEILRNDFEGEEPLRQSLKSRYDYYGNDSDAVDALAARLLGDFADICDALNGRCGYRFPAGVSTFGRQLEWAPKRLACAHGRKKGEILAGNCSPTPGSDSEGVTARIRSYCKLPLKRMVSGAALDLKLLPSNVRGEDGLQTICSLLRGFVSLGGFFLQPDIADPEILRDAQKHPEDYQTLSVRVSGWNARFVTLSKEWQDMIVEQTEQ